MEKKQYFNFPKSITDFIYTDMSKFQVATWIIINTNYSEEEFNGLKQYQCYFSYKTMEKLFNITPTKLKRIINELEKEGVITWVYKSTSRHKSSILTYNLAYKKDSENRSGKCSGKCSGKTLDNTGIEGDDVAVNVGVNVALSNTISNTKSNIYNVIFDFWNDKKIIVHRSLTTKIEKAIDKALKEYTVEDIKQAIDNYNTVIKDNGYFFKYKWTLIEFLTRAKEGIKQISMFLEDGSQWINYQNWLRNKNNIIPFNKREFKRTPVKNNNDELRKELEEEGMFF